LVENVFSDITSDYEYRDELQELYDRGMVYPDDEGRFRPYSLLDRDEFVGISMEVTCKRCIQPHTQFQYIEKYVNEDVYYDINSSNKYFYCVAEADANNFVRWYDAGFQCEDGTQRDNERPFCTNNNITLEEAVAVILRNSWIFSIEDNQAVMQDILAGNITENIADDVIPRNTDGSPYTFYGYFAKAIDFQLVEYDEFWNESIYSMLNVVDGKIRPKKSVTKEEFLRIAYVALKSNSCTEVQDNELALSIDIWEKTCEQWDDDCTISSLDDPEDTYDFTPDVKWFCEEGIENPTGYIWRFYNLTNGDEFFDYGDYLDDILLPSPWEWRVYLTVRDRCGNTAQVYSTIFVYPEGEVTSKVALNVDILADPIIWFKNLLVDFEAVVKGGVPPFTYTWDFGDTWVGVGLRTEHLYVQEWVYEVLLTVVDSDKRTWSATVLIKVLDADPCISDTDGDGVFDCDDLCPTIWWDISNNGCPIVEIGCWENCVCPDGYKCNIDDVNLCPTEWFCEPIIQKEANCLYSPTESAIFWNASCNSCPCWNFLDFLADVRKCDVVFPAITSPDATDIYSRGNLWEIRK